MAKANRNAIKVNKPNPSKKSVAAPPWEEPHIPDHKISFISCDGFLCPVCKLPIEYACHSSKKEYSLTCKNGTSHYQSVMMVDGSNYREYFHKDWVTVARYSPSNVTMIQFLNGLYKPKYLNRIVTDYEAISFLDEYRKWVILT